MFVAERSTVLFGHKFDIWSYISHHWTAWNENTLLDDNAQQKLCVR